MEASFNLGSGQTGDIMLSTLTLEALGSPGDMSYLNLTIIDFLNSSPSNNRIPATTENGTFEVLLHTSDIDGDGGLTLNGGIFLAKHCLSFPGYEAIYGGT